MKIRNGFVSNSSSSSFLIYGICIEKDREAFGKSYDDDEDEDFDIYSHLEESVEKNSQLSVLEPSGGDDVYIGLSWDEVKDDETGKQFKERAEKEIAAALKKAGYKKDIVFATHSEAWYDG